MKSVEEVLGDGNINTRALLCYNFVAQDVFTVDESEVVAWCTVQDNLLVATSRSYIEVRDLDTKGQLSLTFPTVARVAVMDYCERGNYVVTLENADESSVVRLYLNWWVKNTNQAFDVRKIGSPPQDSVATNRLQVVEFVATTQATCVACCGRSGAIAVAESDVVKIFCPKMCSSDLGKQYEDFYLLVSLKLLVAPVRVFLLEDHFAYYTNAEVHVLRLCFESDGFPPEVPGDDSSHKTKQENIFDNVDCSNITNDTHFVEWTFGTENSSNDSASSSEDKLKSVLHGASFPSTLTLRSESFRAIISLTELSEKTILGPRKNSSDFKITATLNQDVEPSFALSNVTVITMLYRRLSDGKTIQAFQWVPYYSKLDKNDSTDPLTQAMSQREIAPSSVLHSPYYESLKSLSCFISSTDEGCLYDLTMSTTLLSVYKYSSPLKSAFLAECFLHAFTNTGLETYVLHTPSRALPSNLPLGERSAVLVGLRPFLGISTVVTSDDHLVLLSSSEDSMEQSSTVYSLLKPTVCQFYNDLKEAAGVCKSEEDKTKFVEMLSDAFVVMSTSILLRGTTPCSSEIRKARSDLCCLLGDTYIKDESQKCTNGAAAYYIHSEQPTEAILGRILSFKGQLSGQHLTKAIVAFLKLDMCRAPPTSEISTELGSENVAEGVLETIAEECPDLLHKLVLRCRTPIFRTEKSINVLRKKLTNKRQSPIYAANAIAVSFLLHKTGNEEAAQNILKALQKESLVLVLLDMHDLIHKDQNITDLGRLIKATRPDAYLSMLVHLKFSGTLSAEQAVFLLEHSYTERELHRIPLLKEFLEAVLSSKRTNAASCAHLLTMLIKIYIGRMVPEDKSPQHPPSNLHSKPASLFGSRAPWIKELPPFNGSSVTKSCCLYATSVNLSECCLCWNCWDDLLRLQSLLDSSLPSASVKAAALETLTNTGLLESENYISLKALCLPPGDAISVLVENYPASVLGFMQDKFFDDTSQWLWLYKAIENKQATSQTRDASKAYTRVMHGVLSHLSNVLSPGEFVELLPCGKPEYVEYVTRCTECHQAKILREKIICLGTELKEMM